MVIRTDAAVTLTSTRLPGRQNNNGRLDKMKSMTWSVKRN